MFGLVKNCFVSSKYQLFKPYHASMGDKCAFPSNSSTWAHNKDFMPLQVFNIYF